MNQNNYISVIIPTRNRADLIKKFLFSIQKQTLEKSNYEIFIIDNGSTDNTKDIVNDNTSTITNLHYIDEPSPGLHSGRHRGCLESKSEILVFADDDIEPFPTWLATIQKCFQDNPSVVLIGGKNLPNFENDPPEWLKKMWEPNQLGERNLGYLSIIDLGDKAKQISPYNVFGCNFAIRRSILEEADGFHPDGMPQELIQYRGDGESHVSKYIATQGYEVLYHPDASVYHLVSSQRMTIDYFCRRAYNQGVSDSYSQIRAKAINTSSNSSGEFILKLKSLSQKINFKTLLNICRKLVKKKTENSIKLINLLDIESEQIQTQISNAYEEGFNFHQKKTQADQKLMVWVLRPNYWDYQLPK